MKSYLLITLFLTSFFSFAQLDTKTQLTNINENNNVVAQFAGNSSNRNQLGSFTFYNPKFDRDGTVYLFEKWNNSATIFVKNNKGFFIESNINFNIQRSMFESQKADSIFSYNFYSIERIVIGNKSFKSYFFEPLQRQRVFEIVFAGEDYSLLKGYSVSILEASVNPMIARPRDKYIQHEDYFIETKESITKVKLKKKFILKALSEEDAVKAINYAKENKLSFRKESDVKKILTYIQ